MGDTTATRQGHQFSRIQGRRHVRYTKYVFSKILHNTAVHTTVFRFKHPNFRFIPIRKFSNFRTGIFSQLAQGRGRCPGDAPRLCFNVTDCNAPRACCCGARCARAMSRRSGHFAALGPCCCARAMLLRPSLRLRLLRCVCGILVLRLVCAGLFAMGQIETQVVYLQGPFPRQELMQLGYNSTLRRAPPLTT